MSVDSIGDFLTIIRNGVLVIKAKHRSSSIPRLKFEIAQILKDEGFIKDVVVEEEDN